MTDIIDRIDPCGACGKVHGRIRYQAHPRNDVEGSGLRDLVLAIVGVVVVVAALAWAEGHVPDVAAFLAGVL